MFSRMSDEINEIIQDAKQHESIGRYNDAAKILVKYWKNTNERPDILGLNEIEQAEILFRCGSLAGYSGSCKQKKDAQELARTLIEEAMHIFLLNLDFERVAECVTHIAAAYQRMGQLDEARSLINSALNYDIDKNSETRLHTHVVEGVILIEEGRYAELVSKCLSLETLFQRSGFLILQGDFNNNYAYGLMKTGDKERAIGRFKLARYFYTQTKHYLYLALLENNLAIFYKGEELYAEARGFAESARENFKKLGDKTREGYSIDTQAQIYLAEGKFTEALKCANEAVMILQKGENYCYLVNSMETKSRIELELKDYTNYAKTIIACTNTASIHLSQRQADKFIDSLADLLSNRGNLTK
jgi:tetratricopeptide (TPR) repeat protein